MGQSLRGFVGQGMSGRRGSITAPTYSFPSGSHIFTAPTSGWFRFVMWGGGGGGDGFVSGSGSGGSGAYVEAVRHLAKGQTVALVIADLTLSVTDGAASTATFPSGEVIAAGGGKCALNGGAGGVATAGALDTKINGTQGVVTGGGAGPTGGGNNPGSGGAATSGAGGAGAPGNSGYKGGGGGSDSAGRAGTGGGGGTPSGGSLGYVGGAGSAIVVQVRIGR